MKKRIHSRILTALLLAVSMLSTGLYSQTAAKPANEFPLRERKTTDGFRIATANVRQMFKKDYKTGNGWEDRKDICRDAIIALNADIIAMQENREPISNYLLEKMDGFALSNGLYRDGKAINPIMYSTKRFERIKEGGFWLSPTPNVKNTMFPGATLRVACWVLLKDKTNGKQLYVVNTHYTHDSNDIRVLQVGVMLDFTKTLPKDIPILMTADYNCGMDSDPMKKITDAGWVDTYSDVHGSKDPGFTFHGFQGEKRTKKSPKIDHIIRNKYLKCVDAEVAKDHRGDKYPSDHYFITAEMVYVK